MEEKAVSLTEREILSPEQLAEYLGCKRTRAYELLSERAIPSFKVGRLRRIRRSDVDRYIEKRLAEEQEVLAYEPRKRSER